MTVGIISLDWTRGWYETIWPCKRP